MVLGFGASGFNWNPTKICGKSTEICRKTPKINGT